ncbi:Mv-ORF17 peptide [Maruca vitrata nucleopolyhedrovirus]|uniref:Mv-ORF17 peptide n=1 Tax=Maruca vitrata nucleopolyhedrovirus TaxID=1307954 RepID=A1YR79_9ABAC|nr:Mv-ORF17 peptide [Maruca vitrata nucleopolyhedrovirus]ABL75969.1 Mv-ORF17 peptide [Maruca vitrata nucleopolyhedrovirus]
MDESVASMCVNNALEYTADDLLKNIPFSHSKCAPFKLHNYTVLKRLSNGFIDKSVEPCSIGELQKFNFKIDRLTNYISNIFEYEFVVLEHDLSTVHVVNTETKTKLGHLNVSLNQNDANVLTLTATLTS